MQLWWLLSILLVTGVSLSSQMEDNEFAEFEDDEPAPPVVPKTPAKEPDERIEQAAEKREPAKSSDFDDDDFGIEGEEDEDQVAKEAADQDDEGIKAQPLKFADVPAHFRSNWGSYQVEALALAILSIYMLNYIAGRTANQAIAFSWVDANKQKLEEQFSVVGDDGLSEAPSDGQLQRETDNVYAMWCTGRVGVNGCMVHVRTLKRHDMLSRVISLFNRGADRVILTFDIEAGELDPYVISVGQKKATARLHKDMMDLGQYTQEKRMAPGANQLPTSFTLYSESAEAAQCLLDPPVLTLMKKYEHLIEYIHISDQFTGPKPAEGEQLTRLPEPRRIAAFSFIIDAADDQESGRELLEMVFYVLDKMRRFRLSKEAKFKADKRRQAVQEAFLKTSHQQRQEAAQARREEKTKERKQRLLEEEDPEKQRRLEKLELKREQKAKQPKMKQLKMK